MREIRICLDLSLQLLVPLEIIIGIRVFNVNDKRVLLTDLKIIVSKLILIVLVLSPLDLILVRVFSVLVEVRLTFTINADFE
jgi:hypothetical protein